MLPIAGRWFERRTLSPGLTLPTEPHVDPFLRCNIWHVRGRDHDLVIDTGLGITSLRDAARDLFERPLAAVATHTHMDHTGRILTAIPHDGYDPRAHEPVPAAPTRSLSGGDIVDLGDRSFEVLHLPGHSPGSIGLWDARERVLFSGDAIYDGPLLDELPGSDICDYVATVKRLRELRVDVVHGGHEPSFGRARLIELCDAYLAKRT